MEDILYQLTDGTHSTPKYMEDGVPFLSVKDISNGYISFDNTKYISFDEHIELSKRCNPEKGDILLSKVGTTGVPVLIETDIHFNIFVSLALLKFFTHFINGKYLIYLIQSPLIQEQVKENTRGVGNKNWVLKSIANTLITFPPLAEQKRIVARIEELLPFIEQYEKKEQELAALHQAFPERLKKSILQAAIQGKLTEQNPNDESAIELVKRIQAEKERLILEKKIKKPKQHSEIIVRDNSHYEIVDGVERCIDDEIPFEIPESWCWVRLGDISLVQTGNTPSKIDKNNYSNNDVPFFKPSDLTQRDNIKEASEYLSYVGSKKARIADKNSLLINGIGNIGQVGILRKKGAFNQQMHSITLYSQSNIELFFYFIQANRIQCMIKSASAQTTIPIINKSSLEKIMIPLPSVHEQKRIVAKIEQLFLSLENLG